MRRELDKLLTSLQRVTRHTWVQTLAILVVAAGYLAWLQFLTPWIVEIDGYYHIKVAYLIRTTGFLHEFPWAAFSLWRDSYFDKELGYHLLLSLFSLGDLEVGAKLGAVAFGAFFFLSFFLVLRLSGMRWAWAWTLLLLLGSARYFGWRVGLTRPHVWSMSLSLWAMFFVLKTAPRRLAATSAVYALSYTAPHVAIGYAVLGGIAERLIDKRWRRSLVVAATLGVGAGWLLHPNFPTNFLAFKVQIIDVLWSAWHLSGPNLHLGSELAPAPVGSFILEHLLVFLVILAAAWIGWRLRPKLDSTVVTLGLTAIGYFVLTCLSKRFVEYWLPFTFWACAWFLGRAPERWRDLLPRRLSLRFWPQVSAAVLAGAALVLLGRSVVVHYQEFAAPTPAGARAGALWLAANTPADSQVFTCDWDDAPELFFYNHRNRYVVFLDPSYLYRWRPDLWKLWDDTANARDIRTAVSTIRDTFGARFGYCTNDFAGLRGLLERDPRATIRSREGGGYVFEIGDGPAPPPTSAPASSSPRAPFRRLGPKGMKLMKAEEPRAR